MVNASSRRQKTPGSGKKRGSSASVKPDPSNVKPDPDPAVRQLEFEAEESHRSNRNSSRQKPILEADPIEATGSELTPGKRKSRTPVEDEEGEIEEPVGRSKKSAVRRRKQR